MASANFLEEALSTDVDPSAVSALVGSLENQLVTSTPLVQSQTGAAPSAIAHNHVNSAIVSNGGTLPQVAQKHQTIANGGDPMVADANKLVVNNSAGLPPGTIIAGAPYINQAAVVASGAGVQAPKVPGEPLKSAPTQQQVQQAQAMSGPGAIITNRVTFPATAQNLPNGTIGLSVAPPHQATNVPVQTIQAKQPTLVIKTSGAPPGAPTGLVTVPMNMSATTLPQVNNVGSSSSSSSSTAPVLSNLQVVNVRAGVGAQPQKGQATRVVLSSPHMVGARPGAPVS